MSDDLPPWATRVTITENVAYVGEDDWNPDPVELLKTLVLSEMRKGPEEKTSQDLNI